MKVLFCFSVAGAHARCESDMDSITMEEVERVERELGSDITCTGIFPLGPSRDECMVVIEEFLKAGEHALDGDKMVRVFPKRAVDGLRKFWDSNRFK